MGSITLPVAQPREGARPWSVSIEGKGPLLQDHDNKAVRFVFELNETPVASEEGNSTRAGLWCSWRKSRAGQTCPTINYKLTASKSSCTFSASQLSLIPAPPSMCPVRFPLTVRGPLLSRPCLTTICPPFPSTEGDPGILAKGPPFVPPLGTLSLSLSARAPCGNGAAERARPQLSHS